MLSLNVVKELAKRVQPKLPFAMQEIILSSYFRLKSQRIRGRTFGDKNMALEESEHFGPDQLHELQSRLLAPVVKAAAHAPYYQQLFRRQGVDPERIRTPEDLKALPILEKDAVRQNAEAFVDGRLDRRKLHVGYTSGTTGTPLRLYFGRDYEALEEAFIVRQWRWVCLGLRDRRVRLRGDVILPAGVPCARPWLRNFADHELRMSSYHLDARSVRAYVTRINSFAPSGMIAYPSSASLLAALAGDQGLECRIPLVFTSSESLSPGQRVVIQRQLGARVLDHYGSTEAAAAMQECESGSIHAIPEYGIVEFVPVERTAVSGLCEIIGTGFTNTAMPLLRYRTGDYARVAQGATCRCGRAFPVVEGIFGRDDDFVVTASGALAGRLDHVFKGLSDIVESQLVQEQDGSIRVLIVPGEHFSDRMRQALVKNVQQRLGDLPVMVEEVGAIPRGPNGKFRGVVSRRMHTGVIP